MATDSVQPYQQRAIDTIVEKCSSKQEKWRDSNPSKMAQIETLFDDIDKLGKYIF